MIYFIDGKKVDIKTEEKPFDKGSEGKIYKKGKYTYKIYYPRMLDESYGNKENFHKFLLTIPTKQIILPKQLIYTEKGEYIGYKAPYISGGRGKNTGITKLSSQEFIKNLQILEKDFNSLSQNHVLAADITPMNYIFDKRKKTMTIIDPGRYRHHCLKENTQYQKFNDNQLKKLIELLLYIDFIEYKPIKSKRKIIELKHYIENLLKQKNIPYSEFFEKELTNYENIEEYAKSLGKYIK